MPTVDPSVPQDDPPNQHAIPEDEQILDRCCRCIRLRGSRGEAPRPAPVDTLPDREAA